MAKRRFIRSVQDPPETAESAPAPATPSPEKKKVSVEEKPQIKKEKAKKKTNTHRDSWDKQSGPSSAARADKRAAPAQRRPRLNSFLPNPKSVWSY